MLRLLTRSRVLLNVPSTWKTSKRGVIVSKSILESVEQSANTESLWPKLREAVASDPRRLIVLDDDPTGCQTVYDINVLLDYSVESITEQLELDDKLFYILANTRSLTEEDAIRVTKQVVFNVQTAVKKTRYPHHIQFISRSDSTLRGHHPAEVQAIEEVLQVPFDSTIVMPAFFEGGRLTFNDVHYVAEGDNLIPAGETPFAKDAHFGFSASNLKDWVVEKTKGTVRRENVTSVGLKDIREGGPGAVANILESQVHGNTVVINAVHEHDMNCFMLGLLQAEAEGMNSIYRTAASFVSSRAGLEPRGLLTPEQLRQSSEGVVGAVGGLIVVGSHVPKTTLQLKTLIGGADIFPLELSVREIIEAARSVKDDSKVSILDIIINRTAAQIDKLILSGKHVVIFTTREFLVGTTLADGAAVSDTLTEIVRLVKPKPAFLVAKGGITSHDVASKSLNISTARVIGQVEPGIPVWKAGAGSRFPNMNYVVFPGNVGDADALLKVAVTLGVSKKSPGGAGGSSEGSAEGGNGPEKVVPVAQPVSPASSAASSSKMLSSLTLALSEGHAIAALNVYNLEGAKAAVAAAEFCQSPVILQVHPSSFRFGGRQLLDLLCSFRTHASVPVFIHIDHADVSDERIVLDILDCKCNVDSVMIDGSSLPLEQNILWTAKMAKHAHEAGAIVEGELGRLTGEEDGMSVSEKESKMTDPSCVAMYVRDTGVDMLAVTIGNVHGQYLHPPKLDFPRLEAIRSAVPFNFPLVLHGASGLSEDLIGGAISRGVCKFNVNTDLRAAAMGAIRDAIAGNKKTDVLHLMEGTTAAMQEVAKQKILLFRTGLKD